MKQKTRSTITWLTAALIILVSYQVSAREIGSSKPGREGVSQKRLDRITEHMNQAVKDGTMVGGLGLIARNGKVVYSETYGLSDREANKPMEADAIFRIYSRANALSPRVIPVFPWCLGNSTADACEQSGFRLRSGAPGVAVHQ